MAIGSINGQRMKFASLLFAEGWLTRLGRSFSVLPLFLYFFSKFVQEVGARAAEKLIPTTKNLNLGSRRPATVAMAHGLVGLGGPRLGLAYGLVGLGWPRLV
jgi:hypothetical protein